MSLRAEVFDGDRDGMKPDTWRNGVWKWRSYLEDSRGTSAVLENDAGDQVRAGDPNRFEPEYGDKQYAKLKDLERGIRSEYGKRLHTAMLTLTASSTDAEGRPLPPVDHLDGLLSSWEAVTRSLRRSLEGHRYERLAILEPHESGYLHVHIAVFIDGVVSAGDFAPVIEAHLRNCDLAGEDAHDLEDDSTVSVRWAGSDRDAGEDHLDEIAIYLAEYLGTFGDDPLEAPEHVQMANAVLWATGRQRWRPSNGAQEYMATHRSPPDPSWEFVGIEDAEGELHEVGGGGGGVTKLETYIPDREDPPPSRWGGLHEDRR